MARQPTPVNIRNFSVKCGRCGNYQVLVTYEPSEEFNTYNYECEWSPCNEDEHRSRTVLEVPVDLDEFANRDKTWHGGKVHAGAEERTEEAEAEESEAPSSQAQQAAASEVSSKGSGLLPVISGE